MAINGNDNDIQFIDDYDDFDHDVNHVVHFDLDEFDDDESGPDQCRVQRRRS